MNIIEILELQSIPQGCRKRMDCPECGGKNTLSVSHDERGLVWYCFHASCGTKGTKSTRLREDSFKSLVGMSTEKEPQKLEWLPHWHGNSFPPEAYVYIGYNNCKKAHADYPQMFAYDVKQNRLMFMVYKDGLLDACGRALDQRKPKWYRYGQAKEPFICRTTSSKIAILVEDCASACAVYPRYNGVAILGTSLLDNHLTRLKEFDKVIVALDKDATDKSIHIAHRLGIADIKHEIVFLEEDLKRNPEQI